MFTLQSITIEGFRGFPKKIDFDLDAPVVLVVGPNGTGKSSLACAIEWCLFGPDVETESHTGIRERVSWESRNRAVSQCLVEIEFTGNGETLVVHRSAPSSGKPDFWFRMGSSPPIREGGKLKALLGGLEIKDFFTAIHLHQESLRGLLLAKPGERKQDFYRLLGLASLVNQAKAIADAKLESLLGSVDGEFEKFEAALEGKVQGRQADIQRARQECLSEGLTESDLSRDGLSKVWTALANQIRLFCTTYAIKDCYFPDQRPEKSAIQVAKEQLQKLRAACPVLESRGQVLARINTLEGLRGSYSKAETELGEAKAEIKKLPPEERDSSKLKQEIEKLGNDLKKEKDKRSEVNAKASVLGEALTYFDEMGMKGRAKCPVCGKEVDSVEGLRQHYEKEIEEGIIPQLDKRIKDLQAALKKANEAQERIGTLQGDAKRKEDLVSAQRNKIAKVLDRVLSAKDDVVALVSGELKELNSKKEKLERQVEKAEESLAGIDQQIERIAKLLDLIRYQDDLVALSETRNTEAYKRTEGARLKIEELVRAVETLSRSLTRTLEEEAETRLGTVKDTIAKTFEGLTGRSDFPRLAVSSDTKFAAQVQGSAGVADALSVLNQADTNCAALSIFLALAVAPSTNHKMGFLILDDPNQSLDEVHTQRLVAILSKIAESRQLILSTIDETLCAQLQQKATKKKVTHRFSDWDAQKGPRVEMA
jgi:DNA repair exonuclease SbcCD ATPase subunit